MRKALLIVAMLLLVTPVMATTTITAVNEGQITTPDGNKMATVRIDYSGDVNVRAFALDINIETGPAFQRIRNFKTGESNAVSKGYGIFPSRFRDFIVVANPNWVDTNYNPTTAWNEPETLDHNSGMGWPKMIVEMGALYAGDANKPAMSGTLFRFDVNNYGIAGTFHITVKANALRGGVVGNDGNPVPALSFVGATIVFTAGSTVPNIVGQTQTVADACIIAAGLTVGVKTTQYSDVCGVDIVMTQNPAAGGTVPPGTAVDYKRSLGKFPTPSQILYPTYDPDCNIPIFWAAVAGTTGYELDRSANGGSTWTNFYDGNGIATFYQRDSVPVGATYRYRVRAKNADSTSLYRTGAVDCNAILSTCYKDFLTTDPNWAQWRNMGRPDCWCKFKGTGQGPRGTGYQCDGDANGDVTAPPDGFRIYNNDLTLVLNNWKKKVSDITMDPNFFGTTTKISAACADMDHKGTAPPDSFRVYNADVSLVTNNWKKKNSSWTGTDKLPGNCPR